jgi:hypothetical protein
MSSWNRVIRVAVLASLFAGAFSLVAVVGTQSSAWAQANVKQFNPDAPDGSGPTAGDPDAPTGDLPPNTSGTLQPGGGTLGGSVGVQSGVVSAPVEGVSRPGRRGGMWAHWMQALKLWLRVAYLR